MTAVQPSKVDMCRLLSDQPVGAIEYIDKEVNVKEFDWDYWQLHRCEKTTLETSTEKSLFRKGLSQLANSPVFFLLSLFRFNIKFLA